MLCSELPFVSSLLGEICQEALKSAEHSDAGSGPGQHRPEKPKVTSSRGGRPAS